MDWYLQGDHAESVTALRQEILSHLARHAGRGSDLDSAELVVSELLGNVVRHAAGPAWVSLNWSSRSAVLDVTDLGPGFELPVRPPEDLLAESGRGLMIVGALANDLAVAARRSGGSVVSVTLPVTRDTEPSFDPPRRRVAALPLPEEVSERGGFGKEAFLRALVVQLAEAVEDQQGPDAAAGAVAQVGTDVGGRMEEEYRAATGVVGRLTPEQIGECYVRLKHAIDGGFYVIEASPGRIVLGNDRCPFGDVVRRAPSLCRMTSSVFGGIAARNASEGATVLLEERIALGDPCCRVVVDLDPSEEPSPGAHRYVTPHSP